MPHARRSKSAILRAVVQQYIETAQPVGSANVVVEPTDVGVSPGDGAQRDDAARARGLPGPAAHVGRSDPHREGLPVLRRRARWPGRARPGAGPPGPRVLRPRPRRARGDAARTRAGCCRSSRDHDRGRGRRGGEPATVPLGAARRASPARVSSSWSCCRRGRSSSAPSSLRRRRRRRAAPGRAGASSRRSSAAACTRSAWHDRPTGDARVDRWSQQAATTAIRSAAEAEGQHVYVEGASRIAGAFDATVQLREVLGLLEQQLTRRDAARRRARPRPHRRDRLRDGRGPAGRVLRGRGAVPHRRASTPVRSACLGPTRMNYPETLAAVAVVSQRLSRMLTEG